MLIRQFLPRQEPLPDFIVTFEMTRNFYREVDSREEHAAYCAWYREVAQTHQRELAKMQGDINVMGWFCRDRRS